jgi:16S rRNA (uracil1498-N3)-methyltransferase
VASVGEPGASVTPRTSAAHAFVTSLTDPVLDPDDRHHLERVLRLRAGASITVSDGQGGWRPMVLGADLSPLGDPVADPAPAPVITIAFAVVKGDRPELITRGLTEIGVDRIVPLGTARGVVRWEGDRGRGAVERLRRVVRSAGMQCRRVWLPEVTEVVAFGDAAAGAGVAMAVPGGGEPNLDRPTVLIGPEGGWAPEEQDVGLPRVDLGPHVLRTETAALVAAARLVALRPPV